MFLKQNFSNFLTTCFFIFAFFAFTACSGPKNLIGDNLSIDMKKGSCFGSCPVYKLHIDKTGIAIYDGERFTDKIGKHSLQIGEKKLNDLVTKIEEMKLGKYKDRYESKITDLPTITISYTNGDFTKSIEGKQERPETIKKLQKLLEEIGNMEGYVSNEPKESKKEEPVEEDDDEGEEDSIIDNEFIVQFNDKVIISRWMKKWTQYRLNVKKPLDDDRKTWLMSYNRNSIEPNELLALLQADADLVSAEFNKKMEKR